MSVHRREEPTGAVAFQVKWRVGGRARSKTFRVAAFGTGKRAEQRAQAAAVTFDDDVRRQLATTGVVVQNRGAALISDSWKEWYSLGCSGDWSTETQETYASALDKHILPRLGGEQIAAIKPTTVEKWIKAMRDDGVGPSMIAKSTTVLSSLMSYAVRADQIDVNPVRSAKKAPAPRVRTPLKITPLQVELLRKYFIDRGHLGDAMLISLLAYAGLRPESEAIVLDWRANGARMLRIPPTRKRGSVPRDITKLQPLDDDLTAWRRASGRVGGLIVPFGDGGVSPFGEAWKPEDWNRWRGKTLKPTKGRTEPRTIGRWAKARAHVGLPVDAIPRDLRGSFASLLIWEGRSIIDAARQAGHKPSTFLDIYAGEFAEFDPINRRPAVEVIIEARREVFEAPSGLQVVRSHA